MAGGQSKGEEKGGEGTYFLGEGRGKEGKLLPGADRGWTPLPSTKVC